MAAKQRLSSTFRLTEYTLPSSNTLLVRPPSSAGATLSGCPSMAVASVSSSCVLSTSPSIRFAPSRPAMMQAEEEPRPRAMGMGFVWVILRGGICLPTFSNSPLAERYTRFDSPRGMRVPSDAEISSTSLSSKVTVLYNVTARPSASKPEPTLALVAGTETLIFIAAVPFRYTSSGRRLSTSFTLPPTASTLRAASANARSSARSTK